MLDGPSAGQAAQGRAPADRETGSPGDTGTPATPSTATEAPEAQELVSESLEYLEADQADEADGESEKSAELARSPSEASRDCEQGFGCVSAYIGRHRRW